MAKLPTYEQVAKEVAEKVLDEYLIDGKALREWIKIIEERKPKTGHWVRDTITDLYHCSCCRYICRQDPKDKDDYCPNCGARMSEVSE